MQLLYFGTTVYDKGFGLFDITENVYQKIHHNFTEKSAIGRMSKLAYKHSNSHYKNGTVHFAQKMGGTFLMIAGSPTDKRGNTVSCFFTFENKDILYDDFIKKIKDNIVFQKTIKVLNPDLEDVNLVF